MISLAIGLFELFFVKIVLHSKTIAFNRPILLHPIFSGERFKVEDVLSFKSIVSKPMWGWRFHGFGI